MSYFPKLFTTGAFRETPKKIICRIANEVEFNGSEVNIVEAGAGFGEITSEIIDRSEHSKLNYYAFEIDKKACKKLSTVFPQIEVLNENVFNFDDHIKSTAAIDYFICSVPLSFYSKRSISRFILKMKQHVKPGGKIIILFCAIWLLPLLRRHLPGMQFKIFATLPLYFLITFTNNEGNK